MNAYYKPLTYKPDPNGPEVNVHELYPEFRLLDKLSYPRTVLGFMFLIPIRVLIQVIIAVTCNIHLRLLIKKSKKDSLDQRERIHEAYPVEREKFVNAVRCYVKAFMFMNGVKVYHHEYKYEEVYKKYLGPDYKCDINDKDYSLVICNHTGFYEVLLNMIKFTPGFIAKKEILDYLFIGVIADALSCLFVDRSSAESRQKIVNNFYIIF